MRALPDNRSGAGMMAWFGLTVGFSAAAILFVCAYRVWRGYDTFERVGGRYNARENRIELHREVRIRPPRSV